MAAQHRLLRAIQIGIALIAGLVLLALLVGGCAQPPRVYRVGVLYMPGTFTAITDGFKAKMTELGYVEGKNISYELVEAPTTATAAEAQVLAKKLVDDKVDLIFAYPTPSMVGAQAATQGTNISVVFAWANPEQLGLVKNARAPGGNMTGVRFPGPEIITKRLEFLQQIVPQARRIWVGYDKNHVNTPAYLAAVRAAAPRLGLTLVEVPAVTLDDEKADLAARAKSADLGLDAIITMADGFNQGAEGYAMLSQFATEHHVPLCTGSVSLVQQGALFGTSANMIDAGKLAAPLADKVLKGTSAGTLPLVSPEPELYINLKMAQQLGLTVPNGMLKMANTIIR